MFPKTYNIGRPGKRSGCPYSKSEIVPGNKELRFDVEVLDIKPKLHSKPQFHESGHA